MRVGFWVRVDVAKNWAKELRKRWNMNLKSKTLVFQGWEIQLSSEYREKFQGMSHEISWGVCQLGLTDAPRCQHGRLYSGELF